MTYDAIVIGAGSVGNPAAMFLALKGIKTLVIDKHPSPGQGQNKAAIGGVRGTHSDPGKIRLGLRSIEIFSTFKEKYGYGLEWKGGGYCFPVFDEKLEKTLKGLLKIQKSYGLNIDWLDADGIKKVVPGINKNGLRGGTFSPGDGQVSPLKAADAFWKVAAAHGAECRFNEHVVEINVEKDRVTGVKTDRGTYSAANIVIAAGADARDVGRIAGLDLPVFPESHEAGISAPVKQFLGPLIVDMRPGPESRTANFYFGQNAEGMIIFCYTPKEIFPGHNRESTSEFLPVIAKRLIDLIPAFRNLLIRRIWRGLYPMTPDGLPIVDKVEEINGLYAGVGMCGQGFMLGPAAGECLAELIADGKTTIDQKAFDTLRLGRDFASGKTEALK
jgi:sarcosine oxidase subunit beta